MFGDGKIKIGLYDSGIGGLSVLGKLAAINCFDTAFYFGDNGNTPYGNKSIRELRALAVNGVMRLRDSGAEIIVLACNTLSATVIADLADAFTGIPFFGVFPPVESAEVRGVDYVLLATVGTVSAVKARNDRTKAFALTDFAEDIEKNIFSPEKIDFDRHLALAGRGYEEVILGCTHYSLVADKIGIRFPGARLISGEDGTVSAVYNYVFRKAPLRKKRKKEINFLGSFAEKNRAVYEKYFK